MNKTKFSKFRKSAIATLCAVAVTCTGLAAACNSNDNPPDDDTSTPRKEDTQLLKNGNFEYSTVPDDAVHLIKNVNNWSRSGDSSGTMSGIINTSDAAWKKITDYELKGKLDANNDLNVSDSDYADKYVDYNGMDSGDILYIDPYVAGLSDSNIGDNEKGLAKDNLILGGGKQEQRSYKQFLGIEEDSEGNLSFRGQPVYFDEDSGDYFFDEEFTRSVRYAIIDNPQTHYGELTEGETYVVNGEEYKLLVDEDGNYYFDVDGNGKIDKLEDQSVGNVLMVHNYPTNTKYNGIYQYYSSQSITLEANTAAEISVWVKTSDLKFDKGYLLGSNEQDRGAYIEVTQSVASSTIDSFKIKAINTQKILADNPDLDTNNGWLQYTIYVNACDFASSTINIRLGLGDSAINEKVTGYAFFDDVEVKKYVDLEDEGCSFSENLEKLQLGSENASYCSLTSEGNEKIFYADKQVRGGEDDRFSTRFHYLVDLASEKYNVESQKTPINFNDLTVTAGLTTYEDKDKTYASAKKSGATVTSGITCDSTTEYLIPDAMKYEGGRPTFNDLIGIYQKDMADNTEYNFFTSTKTDDSGRGLSFVDLSQRLNGAITGESGLLALDRFSLQDSGSMLVMLSRYGAAYTSTLENNTLFTVNGTDSENNYKIISFWIKTSDMNGATAATVKIVDVNNDENSATITVDSTNVTTNVGKEKDIYCGWVQCFFFVSNSTKEEQTFKIEFSFGNTDISTATATSYNYGWAAMANIQSLDVTEDIFKITSAGTYSKTLNFSEESPKSHTPFDNATRMGNVNKEVGTPSNYYGVNGGSSYVTDKEFGDDYDKQNNKKDAITGLINREGFENYVNWQEIARGFGATSMTSAVEAWNSVFGEDCYQPLIIVDSLRTYYDRVTASEDYIKEHLDQYYIKSETGVFVPADGTEYDENETYYSMSQVKNFGYIGNSVTVTASNYKTISVKVMVTGSAEAWIYLVDSSSYKVANFELPQYTYYYDNDGNVLSEELDSEWSNAEHRNAIVYKLRADGLYDGEDGVYANLSNLLKRFKYSEFENNTFFTADGTEVSYDELEDGVTYYNENGKIASHYLVVGEQKVFEYDAETESYYYLVKSSSSSKKVRSVEVKDFDTQYARYNNSGKVAPEYAVKVDNTNGEWVTVNFVIHTGNQAKDYRLELWSGKRDETGADNAVDGAVAFDYVDSGITSSNYSTILAEYETRIKNIYINLIADTEDGESILASENLSKLNLIELKAKVAELVEAGKITEAAITAAFEAEKLDENYAVNYFTFSWYDSAQYVPFNRETAAAGQTGYDYTASSYSETLVYFSTRDYADNSYNMYVDYSAVDQTISINNQTPDSDGPEEQTPTDDNNQSGWLLITSIILFAVLMFVLIALLIRYLWKKYSKKRGQKQIQKNNYKQRERYIRKLGLVKVASDEEEAPSTEDAPTEETPAENENTDE